MPGASRPRSRTDRPHVYLCQEPRPCPACGTPGEARTILVEGRAERVWRCARCGETHEEVSSDAAAFVAAFLARGRAAEPEREVLFKRTTATCARCLALVPADVVLRGGRAFLEKSCPTCGSTTALVSEDAAAYVGAYALARAGSQPLRRARQTARSCPEDCGLCPDHEQHTCLPVLEITDHCDLSCPVCMVDNRGSAHLEPEAFSRIVEGLIAAEGTLESIALSGGEPTTHPALLELIDRATRPEIGRVVLLTNGLRLARDPALARALKERGVYVSLQLDGFSPRVHERLRGRDLTAEKATVLRVLEELAIPTQLIFVAARGVNEEELGPVVELFLTKEHVLSLNVQPLALTGRGGGRLAGDPLDRLTIPGVLRLLEAQSSGRLRVSDFSPLPCPNPHCVSLAFLLRLRDGSFLPFARFADLGRYGGLLRNSATLPALPGIEEALRDVSYDLLAREEEIERAADVRVALRHALELMFPPRPLGHREAIRAGERLVKSVFIHHYMDAHDFDLERLRKCCHHYPLPDGTLRPMCGFNLFARGAALGPDTPRAAWLGELS